MRFLPWSNPASIEQMLKRTNSLRSLSIPPKPSAMSCHSGDRSVSVSPVCVARSMPFRLSSLVTKCPPTYFGGVLSPCRVNSAPSFKLMGQTPEPNALRSSRRSSSSSLKNSALILPLVILVFARAALRAREPRLETKLLSLAHGLIKRALAVGTRVTARHDGSAMRGYPRGCKVSEWRLNLAIDWSATRRCEGRARTRTTAPAARAARRGSGNPARGVDPRG